MASIERQMEAVAAGKSASWASFLERVGVLRREVPEAPGAEKLLALDLIHELREWLASHGVTVIVPPHGAMMTDGLAPGGLTAFHPSQLVVEPQEVAGSGPPISMDALRRHMDRQRADRERFVKGLKADRVSIEGKYDDLANTYEAEDDRGGDMLGVPAPGNYTAAVLRSPVSVPEQIIGLPVRDGRGRVVGEIKDARKEGDKCVVDVTLNADGVALIEQTQRPFVSMGCGGSKDGEPEEGDGPEFVDDEVHHPDIVNAIRSRELYESAGVGLPECGHLTPGGVASPSPTEELCDCHQPPVPVSHHVDMDKLRTAMREVTLDDIDKAVKGILAPAKVWEPGTKCPTCNSPSPELHPAVQHEGEVQPCKDAFHRKLRPCDLPKPTIVHEDDGEP